MVTLKQALDNKNFENELKAININNGIPISLTDDDYNFCYNIEPGKTINYRNGSIDSMSENNEDIVVIKYDKNKADKDQSNNKYKKYAINIKTKTFHLETKKCRHIQSIEPKYIQGTKAFEDEIIEKGFRLCKNCTNYSKKN